MPLAKNKVLLKPLPSNTVITAYGYNNKEHTIQIITNADQIPVLISQWDKLWIEITGFAQLELIQNVVQKLNITKEALDNALDKSISFASLSFHNAAIVTTSRIYDSLDNSDRKLSCILGEHFLVTFIADRALCFDAIKTRFAITTSLIYSLGIDYLLSALLAAAIRSYIPVLENDGNIAQNLEASLLMGVPTRQNIREIFKLKKQLLQYQRELWYQRQALVNMIYVSEIFIKPTTRSFFQDCHNESLLVHELIDNYLNYGATLIDLYFSSTSQQLNNVMKFLTILSTIFLPISFLAGLWGMNFINMPELHLHHGYFFALLFMTTIVSSLLLFFHKKGWLSAE